MQEHDDAPAASADAVQTLDESGTEDVRLTQNSTLEESMHGLRQDVDGMRAELAEVAANVLQLTDLFQKFLAGTDDVCSMNSARVEVGDRVSDDRKNDLSIATPRPLSGSKTTESCKSEARRLFDECDADGSGMLEAKEIESLC
eukprot:SAG31_NODE_27153_length_430_cov_1.241692_1_plen_143_part_11